MGGGRLRRPRSLSLSPSKGDASVPTPHLSTPRPYENGGPLPKYLPLKGAGARSRLAITLTPPPQTHLLRHNNRLRHRTRRPATPETKH